MALLSGATRPRRFLAGSCLPRANERPPRADERVDPFEFPQGSTLSPLEAGRRVEGFRALETKMPPVLWVAFFVSNVPTTGLSSAEPRNPLWRARGEAVSEPEQSEGESNPSSPLRVRP